MMEYPITPFDQLPQLTPSWDGCTVTKAGAIFVREHIRYSEIACKCGRTACRKVNWALVIDPDILNFFEKLRWDFGAPIYINSGCRCGQHQKDLVAAHKAAISPHVPILQSNGRWRTFGLDIMPSDYDADGMSGQIRELDRDIRIGVAVYNYTLIHIDYAYDSKPNPKPEAWQRGGTW